MKIDDLQLFVDLLFSLVWVKSLGSTDVDSEGDDGSSESRSLACGTYQSCVFKEPGEGCDPVQCLHSSCSVMW